MRLLLQIMKKKSSNWTKFQLLRKNERKTETNKLTNKQTKEQTLGGCIKGLREQLTTAPGKTAVRMVLADIQKLKILHILLK